MISLRPTEAGDLPGLSALFESRFGHPLAPEEWTWKYRQLPGEARSLVAVRAVGAVEAPEAPDAVDAVDAVDADHTAGAAAPPRPPGLPRWWLMLAPCACRHAGTAARVGSGSWSTSSAARPAAACVRRW